MRIYLCSWDKMNKTMSTFNLLNGEANSQSNNVMILNWQKWKKFHWYSLIQLNTDLYLKALVELPRTASNLHSTNSPNRYDSKIPIVTESYIIEKKWTSMTSWSIRTSKNMISYKQTWFTEPRAPLIFSGAISAIYTGTCITLKKKIEF